MKAGKRRLLCGWLVICLVFGMIFVGLAENVEIDMPEEIVVDDDILLELDDIIGHNQDDSIGKESNILLDINGSVDLEELIDDQEIDVNMEEIADGIPAFEGIESNANYTAYSNDTVFNIRGRNIKASDVANQNNCWQYANAIYKKIWDVSFTSDFTGSASSGWNMLRNLSDSDRKLTADNLKSFIGASELGASLRITSCTSSCGQWGNDGLSCGHKGHSLIIVGKDSGGVTVIDNHRADGVNYSVNTRYYTWQGFVNYWGSYTYIKYIKWPNAPVYSGADNTAPIVTKARITGISPNGYYVECEATDNLSVQTLRIGSWNDIIGIDAAHWENQTAVNGKAIFSVSISDYNNAQNTAYHTNVYAIDGSGNVSEGVRAGDVILEAVPPVVTSAKVINISKTGYDVVCKATDNAALSKIQTGTWHNKMSIDDAVWQECVTNGEEAIIHIDIRDFNNMQDVTYYSNVYAIDRCGNVSEAYRAGDTYIASVNPTQAPTQKPTATPTPKPTPTPDPTATPTPKPTATPTPDPTATPTPDPTATPTLTPTVAPAPSEIKLNKTKATVVVGGTLSLVAKVTPSDSQTTLKWSSSNKKVATVSSSGKVKAVAKGTATITVKTANGKKATCKITVPKAPKKVIFKKSTYTVKKGKTITLVPVISPSGAKTVYWWSSSNKKVATVNTKGVVKGVAKGTAIITLKTANGKKATVTIKVK